MEQGITLTDLILPILGLMLSSGVFTAIVTSYLNRRKIIGEALEATGGGIQKIVQGSIDLVEEYRKDFNEKAHRIDELEKEVRRLNERLDKKTEEWLQALAFKTVLEEGAIEQGEKIRRLEQQVMDLQNQMKDQSTVDA